MIGLVSWLLSLGLLAVACIVRPDRARCPAGYDLRTGIRADGRFACWPSLVADPEWDDTRARTGRPMQPAGVVESRVYCSNGTRPIVVNHRQVGCQRGGWP